MRKLDKAQIFFQVGRSFNCAPQYKKRSVLSGNTAAVKLAGAVERQAFSLSGYPLNLEVPNRRSIQSQAQLISRHNQFV
jgi:hypothetical protein